MSDPNASDISAFQFAFGSTAIRDPSESPQSSTGRRITSTSSNASSYPSVLPLKINKENVSFGAPYIYPSEFQAYDTYHDNYMSPGIPLPDAQCRRMSVGISSRKTRQATGEVQPITRPPLSHMVASSPSTASPSVASPSYPTITPRAIHKKQRSYDLRDDFVHHAPAAHAALAEFHSRRGVELLGVSEGDASDTNTKTHWSTASAPQLNSNETIIRTDSRNPRSWPMKGGQLLH
ncbi:hypothetical protein HYPSUDRAFT_62382 [Hypholoma sublateritium FD-334 SS-4]|uniref:Uncharacterized protein n=1 Tax=Hypholoma sublateritium (strain FD-334 SS-4) TaxID=945553 RepID=A0A0D2Q8E8_HYPSF|nr:hypothetical protein HYPSUDRAFT_62382 [Hypholoma sublateritium FD-334 SS-4]